MTDIPNSTSAPLYELNKDLLKVMITIIDDTIPSQYRTDDNIHIPIYVVARKVLSNKNIRSTNRWILHKYYQTLFIYYRSACAGQLNTSDVIETQLSLFKLFKDSRKTIPFTVADDDPIRLIKSHRAPSTLVRYAVEVIFQVLSSNVSKTDVSVKESLDRITKIMELLSKAAAVANGHFKVDRSAYLDYVDSIVRKAIDDPTLSFLENVDIDPILNAIKHNRKIPIPQ